MNVKYIHTFFFLHGACLKVRLVSYRDTDFEIPFGVWLRASLGEREASGPPALMLCFWTMQFYYKGSQSHRTDEQYQIYFNSTRYVPWHSACGSILEPYCTVSVDHVPVGSLSILWFPPTSHKRGRRWIGYAKFSPQCGCVSVIPSVSFRATPSVPSMGSGSTAALL